MNLLSDMKMLHAKKFKDGKIKQATFLKSFKHEILELIELEYKPSEIKDYLEEKLDVSINMNSFYAWLNYTKEKSSQKQEKTINNIPNATSKTISMASDSIKPTNTLDILSSTDYD